LNDSFTTEQRTVARRVIAALRQVKQQVADGHWIRNSVNDGNGNHCMLGLINPHTNRLLYQGGTYQGDDLSYGRVQNLMKEKLHNLVYAAMEEDIAEKRKTAWDHTHRDLAPDANGVTMGLSRGWEHRDAAIATYNNLAEDWQEIYAWLERAETLALQEA
jgi:hypothetical protein